MLARRYDYLANTKEVLAYREDVPRHLRRIGSLLIRFGQYRGKTVYYVYLRDRSYLEWSIETIGGFWKRLFLAALNEQTTDAEQEVLMLEYAVLSSRALVDAHRAPTRKKVRRYTIDNWSTKQSDNDSGNNDNDDEVVVPIKRTTDSVW